MCVSPVKGTCVQGRRIPMVILKLALLSSLFYVGVALLLQAGVFAIAYAKGAVGISNSPLRLGILFGIIWLISFIAAWHIFYFGIKSRLPVPPR